MKSEEYCKKCSYMNEETKFKVGDQVMIVNYGHPYWSNEGGMLQTYDLRPEFIGEIGIVVEAHKTIGRDKYALHGTTSHAWYDNGQLELVYRPEYR